MNPAVYFQLFLVFLRLGLISFGGVIGALPELERMLVVQHGWLTHEEFIQSYAMAQFAPGPNMVMCPMIGYRVAGWGGFLASFAGVYLAPLAIMGGAFGFYRRYRQMSIVRRLELALRPVVLGLLTASAIKLWWAQARLFVPSALPLSLVVAGVLSTVALYLTQRRGWGPLQMICTCGAIAWIAQIL